MCVFFNKHLFFVCVFLCLLSLLIHMKQFFILPHVLIIPFFIFDFNLQQQLQEKKKTFNLQSFMKTKMKAMSWQLKPSQPKLPYQRMMYWHFLLPKVMSLNRRPRVTLAPTFHYAKLFLTLAASLSSHSPSYSHKLESTLSNMVDFYVQTLRLKERMWSCLMTIH